MRCTQARPAKASAERNGGLKKGVPWADAEPYHTDEDEVESDDVVQQAGDYQNQNPGDKGCKRPNVSVCEGHFIYPVA